MLSGEIGCGFLVAAGIAVLSLGFGACGGDDEPTAPARAKPSVSKFKQRVGLCFTPVDVRVSAGKPPFRPDMSKAELAERVHSAVAPTYRGRIRIAKRLGAPNGLGEELAAILAAARQGVRQFETDPTLLRRGRTPGFANAQTLAEEAGLDACSAAAKAASGAH